LVGIHFGNAFENLECFVRLPLNLNNYYGKAQLSPVFQPDHLNVFKWLIDNGILIQVADGIFGPKTKKQSPNGNRLADE